MSKSAPPPYLPSYLTGVKNIAEYGGTGWEQGSIDFDTLKDKAIPSDKKFLKLFGMKLDWTAFPKVYVAEARDTNDDGQPSRTAKAKVVVGDMILSICGERITQVASWEAPSEDSPNDAVIAKIGRRVMKKEKVIASFFFLRAKYANFYVQLKSDVPELDMSVSGKKILDVKPNGWADRRGLQKGDSIVLLNDILAEKEPEKIEELCKKPKANQHYLVRRAKEFDQLTFSRMTDVKRDLPEKWRRKVDDSKSPASDHAKIPDQPAGGSNKSPTPSPGRNDRPSSARSGADRPSSARGKPEEGGSGAPGGNKASGSGSGSSSIPFQIPYLASAKDVKELGLTGWEQRSLDAQILNSSTLNSREKLHRLFGFQLDWTAFPFVRVINVDSSTENRSTAAGVQMNDILVQIYKDRITAVQQWETFSKESPDDAIIKKIQDTMAKRQSGEPSARFVFFRERYERQYAQLEYNTSKQLGLQLSGSSGNLEIKSVTQGSWGSDCFLGVGDRIVAIKDVLVTAENADKLGQKIMNNEVSKPIYFLVRRTPSMPEMVRSCANSVASRLSRRLPSKWAASVAGSKMRLTTVGQTAQMMQPGMMNLQAGQAPQLPLSADARAVPGLGKLSNQAYGFLDSYQNNPAIQQSIIDNRMDPHDLSALEILGKLNRVLFDEHFAKTDTVSAFKPLVTALEVIRRHEARDQAKDRNFRGLDKLLREARESLSVSLGARGAMEQLQRTHPSSLQQKATSRSIERQAAITSMVKQGIEDASAIVAAKETDKWDKYNSKLDAELARRRQLRTTGQTGNVGLNSGMSPMTSSSPSGGPKKIGGAPSPRGGGKSAVAYYNDFDILSGADSASSVVLTSKDNNTKMILPEDENFTAGGAPEQVLVQVGENKPLSPAASVLSPIASAKASKLTNDLNETIERGKVETGKLLEKIQIAQKDKELLEEKRAVSRKLEEEILKQRLELQELMVTTNVQESRHHLHLLAAHNQDALDDDLEKPHDIKVDRTFESRQDEIDREIQKEIVFKRGLEEELEERERFLREQEELAEESYQNTKSVSDHDKEKLLLQQEIEDQKQFFEEKLTKVEQKLKLERKKAAQAEKMKKKIAMKVEKEFGHNGENKRRSKYGRGGKNSSKGSGKESLAMVKLLEMTYDKLYKRMQSKSGGAGADNLQTSSAGIKEKKLLGSSSSKKRLVLGVNNSGDNPNKYNDRRRRGLDHYAEDELDSAQVQVEVNPFLDGGR
ncbi:unnamed protein product [Amoebophrya sp. A120]|nr:unnamed protein product [Amoebophrya sp. A120]|eukprot:GSA120T00007243001.1